MTKALQDGDFGTYRNLLKAVSDIMLILSKSEWKTMFSEYTTDGIKQVAVWEQNKDGEVRDHKTWDVCNVEALNRIAASLEYESMINHMNNRNK